MKCEVVKLKEEDVEKVVKLLEKVFEKEIYISGIKQLVDKEDSLDLIAKINDEVVGHAMVDINLDLFTNTKYLYLEYFGVDPDYRRLGIANKLIEEIEKFAIENDISYMKFTSGNKRVAAHKFYKKHGYTIRDTSVFIKYFK